MKNRITIIILLILSVSCAANSVFAQRAIELATINWEPYTGEDLLDDGFFSELVMTSLARVGYRVEFHYRPWARALMEAKMGRFHGVMNAYWKEDRVDFLSYPNSVWEVKEEFIALIDTPITYDGNLSSLKEFEIGVLYNSAQAEELESAGIKTQAITSQKQNIEKLLAKRIDAMVIPRSVFFTHLNHVSPQFDRTKIKILSPPYKIYNMYVAFSKKKPGYERLTSDFNEGLNQIKSDGTFKKILKKHNVIIE